MAVYLDLIKSQKIWEQLIFFPKNNAKNFRIGNTWDKIKRYCPHKDIYIIEKQLPVEI